MPETIHHPDIGLTVVNEGDRLTVNPLCHTFVFLNITPDRFLGLYRLTRAMITYNFEPFLSNGRTWVFAPHERMAVVQELALSIMHTHVHHNVPSEITPHTIDGPISWTIVLRHASAKFGEYPELCYAFAANVLRQPVGQLILWARIEEDRAKYM